MEATRTPLSRTRRQRLTGITALACLLALAALWFLAGSGEAGVERESTAPLVVHTVVAAEQPGYTMSRRFVGRVEAARESSVGFELGGRIVSVGPDDGDRVSSGQVIARLDTARLDARREELTAMLDEARANRELAESTRQRVRSAHEQDAVSSQRLDEAERQLQARIAAVRRAEAALASVDVDIEKATLQAPFDAIVAHRHLDEGQVIQSGHPVLTLLERRGPEARIGVAEEMTQALAPGQTHPVEIGDRAVPARIKAVVPQRNARTRSVEVVLVLDAALDEIRQGDLAVIEIAQTRDEPGFWLPLGALSEGSRGLWNCYVAKPRAVEGSDATHELSRRELVVLHQEEDRVFVRGTLQKGDIVVREGVQRLAPGLNVRVEPKS